MIGALFSSLGVGWWLPLGLFPLIGAGLVTLYRKQGRGSKRQVPTFFLLREFATTASSPSAIRLPFRFFLELLLLLILCCSAANIGLTPKSKSIAIVFDTSLSMNARKSVSQAGSLFDESKRRALEHISDLASSSQITLFTSSPVLKQRGAQNMSPAEARSALNRIEPTLLGDSLGESISELFRRGAFDRVLVFSDRQPELAKAGIVVTPKQSGRAEIMTVRAPQGASRSNLALGEIGLNSANGAVTGLSVPLISYSEHRSTGRVVVHLLNQDLTWGKAPATSLDCTVDPGKQVDLKIPLRMEANQAYRITWVIDSINPAAQDMLVADNEAYFVYKPGKFDWKVVSRFTEKELNISKLFNGSARVLLPEQFEKLDAQDKATGKTLFHGVAPKSLSDGGTLVINPPKGSSFTKQEKVQVAGLPSAWESGHPLLRYISAGALKFPDATVLADNNQMESVVTLAEGSVLNVAETANRRAVVVGFELLPFEGASAVTKSTLLLNMIKWLNTGPQSTSGDNSAHYVGQRIESDSSNQTNSNWAYIGDSSGAVTTKLAKAGILQSSSSFKSASVLNPVESNLLSQPALPRAYPSAGKGKQEHNTSLSWLFGLLALGLLLLDGIMQMTLIRPRSNNAQTRSPVVAQ
jgi:hypothetical protein